MPNHHIKATNQRETGTSAASNDFWLMIAMTLGALLLLITFDITEGLLNASRPYNGFKFDEIIFASYLFPIVMSWYSFRRWQESQAALERLQHTEAHLSQLCTTNPTVTYTCKIDEKFSATFISPNVIHLTGLPAEHFLKNPVYWLSLLHPDDMDAAFQALRSVIQTDRQTQEYRLRTADGSFVWVRNDLNLICDDNDFPMEIMGSWTDITESKNAESKMHEAEKHAVVANQAKSHLMANMSHELRTPLNAIIGFSYTILEETFGPINNPKYREYLNDIHHSGEHLLDLINDILDVSSLEASDMDLHESYVSLAKMVDVSVRIIRPRADIGGVDIATAIGSTLPLIYVDERRVKQIFLNLLSNAVKFTPPGGEVSVTSWLNTDGSLTVAVSDTGIGMNETEIAMALSAFGQVDSGLNRKHGGTGLGLPLTKGLVERHGGTFEVKSKKGKGTLITLSLPAQRVGQNINA